MEEQNDLKPRPAVMTAQIQIIRAGTGKVEDYTLTFTPVEHESDKQEEAK